MRTNPDATWAVHFTSEAGEFIRLAARDLGRLGGVVGVSGGIDSAVSLRLAVEALGAGRVVAIAMPERESSPESLELATALANSCGVELVVDDLTATLEAQGCYSGRDKAVQDLGLDYAPGSDSLSVRIVQNLRESRMPASYVVDVRSPDGAVQSRRLNSRAYRALFAHANQKQRARTSRLYFHAELRDLVVVGTSNYNETHLGFFVKLGDGSWDVCPIDGLLKSEIFVLARHLGVPEGIAGRETTTDTFPNSGQSQQDMFYGLTFAELDSLLEAARLGSSAKSTGEELGWTAGEVENAWVNLRRRHRSTRWNRATPYGRYNSGL